MPGDEEGSLPEEARARAVLLEMQERMTNGPHAALGIPTHATASDARTAFLQLTKKFHPARFGRMPTDVQRLSTEVFLSLRAAHDTIAKALKKPTGMLPTVTPVRPTAQMPALNRSPAQPAPVLGRTPTDPAPIPPTPQPPSRPTPSQPVARPGTQPQTARPTSPAAPPLVPPRRTPTASPPPQGARAPDGTVRAPQTNDRATPARGVRIVPPAPGKPALVPPTRRADSSASMPALERELVPVYELMERGQWDQARLAIGALAARDKTTKYEALMHYTRGREAQLERRLDEARVELDSALQLDPSLQIAKTALAELFTRRK